MNAPAVDIGANAKVNRLLSKRRATARATETPIDWLFDSPMIAPVVAFARRCAAVPTAPIVIRGERGCGVQALARLVHDADPLARTGRFRVVPAQFVSAGEMRGWLNHGTLVVEDVENLKSAGQAWVAETLAERNGDRYALRIVVTTRLAIGDLLARRHLDQELVHALDVFRLVVPSLRERPQEIPGAARRFLRHYGEAIGRPFLRFSPQAEQKLAAHAYPANVCELRNVVERAVALRGQGEGDIPAEAVVFYGEPVDQRAREPAGGPPLPLRQAGPLPSLVEVERDYLTTLIQALNGRRTEMARVMGVSYPTVLKKISRHRLDVRAIVAASLERGPVAAGPERGPVE